VGGVHATQPDLLLEADMMFVTPTDIGRETRGRHSRGDLICVGWIAHGMAHMPVALPVGAMGGRTCIASKRVIDLDRCENRNRGVSHPRTRTDWRAQAIALSGIIIIIVAGSLADAVSTARGL